jgi:hypothetical protein
MGAQISVLLIFNAQINRNLSWVEDDAVRQHLRDAGAYGYAGTGAIWQLDAVVRGQVLDLYDSALKAVWGAAAAMAGAAFFLVFLEQSLELKMDQEPEFGMEEESTGSRSREKWSNM